MVVMAVTSDLPWTKGKSMSTADENSQNTTPDTDVTAPLEVADQGPATDAGSAPGNSRTRTILEIVGAAVAVVLILVAGVGGFVAGAFAAGGDGDRDFGRAVAEGRMHDGPGGQGMGDQGMQGFGDEKPGHGRERHHGSDGRGGMGDDFDWMPMDEAPGGMMDDFPQPPSSTTEPQPSPAA